MPKRKKHGTYRGTTAESIGEKSWWARHSTICGAAIVAIASVVIYWPSIHGGFLLDDGGLVTDNYLIKSPEGLAKFWLSAESTDYWPVTNSSFWLEWRLWGMNPTGYHVTNLVLHIAGALLIWRVLGMLSIPGAFLAAILFVVHPVNVESVAWISQRKNTLALVFYLLSVLWYLRFDGVAGDGDGRANSISHAARWYELSLFAFVLSMLSKGSVAILPPVLLVLVWWRRRRVTMSDIRRTVPFFVVAIVLTCVNLWFQKHGKQDLIRDVNFGQRLTGAGAAVWFYLGKALAPIELIFIYPQWRIEISRIVWWLPLGAAALVTAVLLWRRNGPWGWTGSLLFAWVYFCIALAPVLGFADVGFMKHSLVADHYQQIALVAVVAIVASAWSVWHDKVHPAKRWGAQLGAVVVVGILMVLTIQQARLYADPTTLYEATLAKNPDSWLAHNNLGERLMAVGNARQAKAEFEEVIRLQPEYAKGYYNLGFVLASTGHLPEAVELYQKALRRDPEYLDAMDNLGVALAASGKIHEAIEQHLRAKRLAPNSSDVHNNLGGEYLRIGQIQESIAECETALRLNPDMIEAQNTLGIALAMAGEPEKAIGHLQAVVRSRPDSLSTRLNLGIALMKVGRAKEAIQQFNAALRLKPDRADIYLDLAAVFAQVPQPEDAEAAARRAIELAKQQGQTGLADQAEKWLREYRAGARGSSAAAPQTKNGGSIP